MAEPRFGVSCTPGSNLFKEAVCIDTKRIYDSCSDRDCLEDLAVYFTDAAQPYIDDSTSIKVKSVEILDVDFEVEPVPFNKGFYSVDMTFYFQTTFSVTSGNSGTTPVAPTLVEGLSICTKKAILYGSEGNVKVYSTATPTPTNNMPTVSVSAVDPMLLSFRVTCPCPGTVQCGALEIPQSIRAQFAGSFDNVTPQKIVCITLGLFTIVQIERDVQMMIPAYDFCVPDKECSCSSDDPCELFSKIQFPMDDFFPPKANECVCEPEPPEEC